MYMEVRAMILYNLKMKLAFEESIGMPVDIVDSPLKKDDLLEVNKEIELYVT